MLANKNIMVGILLAGKAFQRAPYVKRYKYTEVRWINSDVRIAMKSQLALLES